MIPYAGIRLDALDFEIRSLGCIACLLYGVGRIPCEKHHLNAGDTPGRKRRGERFVIGLCRWHHVGACACPSRGGIVKSCIKCIAAYGPSWFHHKRRFITRFGSGDELIIESQTRIFASRRGAI